MKHLISLTTCKIEVDENTTLDDIERGQPLFFKTPHGKRETFTIYRGFLIIRNTVDFGRGPERKTAVYAYTNDLEGRASTFCVSSGNKLQGIPQAKRLIDTILKYKQYSFGMAF